VKVSSKLAVQGHGQTRRVAGSTVGPKAVGSFIAKLAKRSFERYGFATAAILTDWKAIVGPDLAAYTQPERLRWPRLPEPAGDTDDTRIPRGGATLHLRVTSARALDVQYASAQILERINSYFGYRAVTQLRILQAPLTTTDAKSVRLPTTDAAETSRVDGRVEAIENADLRSALTRLGASVGRAAAPRR